MRVTPPFSVWVVEALFRSTVLEPLTLRLLVAAPSVPDPVTNKVPPPETVLLPE